MRFINFILFSFTCLTTFSYAQSPTLYQAGTLFNLLNGIYIGDTTINTMLAKGDFGLGTRNGPEGEMVILNRKVYVADLDANAKDITPKNHTPYTMIIDFKPQTTFQLSNIKSLAQLISVIEKKLPSQNIFYAIKVTSHFKSVRLRNWQKPSTPIPADTWINAHQRIKTLNHISGTLVIFKAPHYLSPITVGGYHIHFISQDAKRLGHVYNIQTGDKDYTTVAIQPIYQFELILPHNRPFLNANLKITPANRIAKLEHSAYN